MMPGLAPSLSCSSIPSGKGPATQGGDRGLGMRRAGNRGFSNPVHSSLSPLPIKHHYQGDNLSASSRKPSLL